MYPSQIRRPLVAAAALVAWAVFAPVYGGDVQVTIPSLPVQIFDPSGACASWTPGGTATAPTLTCVAANPGAPGVPVCTIKANNSNPLTITSPTQVALSATCTNTDTATTWSWTGGAAVATGPGASPKTQTVQVDATTTFSVIATNSVGASNSKSVTVTLSTAGGGGGSGGAVSCTGFKTINLDLDNATGTAVSGTFGNGDIVVARFHTPSTLINNGSGGLVSVGEFSGSPAKRTLAISTTACDFTKNAAKSNYLSGYTQPTINFGSGGLPLQPDTTYYVNIVNKYPGPTGAGTCTTGSCGVIVTRNLP